MSSRPEFRYVYAPTRVFDDELDFFGISKEMMLRELENSYIAVLRDMDWILVDIFNFNPMSQNTKARAD